MFRGSDPEGYRAEFVRLVDLAGGLTRSSRARGVKRAEEAAGKGPWPFSTLFGLFPAVAHDQPGAIGLQLIHREPSALPGLRRCT